MLYTTHADNDFLHKLFNHGVIVKIPLGYILRLYRLSSMIPQLKHCMSDLHRVSIIVELIRLLPCTEEESIWNIIYNQSDSMTSSLPHSFYL